jgi:hypothetical protein
MTLTPMSAAQALDAHFLEARSRLLDLAAILDRIDRGADALTGDPRLAQIRTAIQALSETKGPDRAARVQELFSLPYDSNWKPPTPR